VRADPLTATAVNARRWLLVEHPGPWAPDAFAGSGIDPEVRRRLTEAVRASGTRLLLIRRPGRIHRTWPRSWAVVSAAPGAHPTWGTWHRDADLAAALPYLSAPPPQGAFPASADPTAASSDADEADALILVCAHGRHDTCCAVRGRPVAAALAERWPTQTWECSHVGGDRFAANVVLLPDGAYYGDVEPSEAVGVVAAHLSGAMSARHLRGLSTQPPVVQAAFNDVLTRFGPAGPRDATATRLTRLAEDRWRVELTCSPPLPSNVTVTVTRSRRAPALLTCRAQQPAFAWQWSVGDVSTG
jgi:hypothetical protein